MGIISGGVQLTGGLPIEGVGTINPLKTAGAPTDNVDEVAAAGTLTIAEPVSNLDSFTIDTTVYRLMTTPAAAYDIAIGANEAASKVNIVAAINASGTPGTEYFAGPLIHPTVTATAFAGDAGVLTAKTAGTAGNAIVSIETAGQGLTHASNVFDATTLGTTTAGVDNVNGSYYNRIPADGFVYDITNSDMYENTGTSAKPTYGKIDA